jgi:hypothetical protein
VSIPGVSAADGSGPAGSDPAAGSAPLADPDPTHKVVGEIMR